VTQKTTLQLRRGFDCLRERHLRSLMLQLAFSNLQQRQRNVCLSVYPIYTWHDDSEHPAVNVQQTSSCSWNPKQMKKQIMTLRKQKHKKLQELWRNSSDPLSFVSYYNRGEERERERAREREREKRRKRERRGRRKRLRCKKTTQTARGEQVTATVTARLTATEARWKLMCSAKQCFFWGQFCVIAKVAMIQRKI
jgi:hypothetical protein